MKGKFITIEGCEGVGKSTQLRLLKEYCATHTIDALFTREPGGCEIAEQIRGLIMNADNRDMTDVTELLLYCAARAQHTDTVIRPALEAGKTVFCDRYSDSTAAYQGYARGLDLAMVHVLNAAAQGGVRVDYTIFMDVDPEVGFTRKGGAGNDRLEHEALAFHKKVYAGFCALADAEPQRFLRFKAQGTKYETHELIVKKLQSLGIL